MIIILAWEAKISGQDEVIRPNTVILQLLNLYQEEWNFNDWSELFNLGLNS